MTIHYDQQIWTSQRVTVTGDTEVERNQVEDHLRTLGYQRKLWITGEQWSMNFIRTEVVADTARGDKIALDGRWEAADEQEK